MIHYTREGSHDCHPLPVRMRRRAGRIRQQIRGGADEPNPNPPILEGAQPESPEGSDPQTDPVTSPTLPYSGAELPDAAPVSVPLWGGSIATEGNLAVVADPSKDVLVVLDVDRRMVTATPDLHLGDGPFRVDVHNGVAFATLRGSAGLAIYDINAIGENRTVSRVPVGCPEPRGLTVDQDEVLVACASGEIVSLDLSGNILSSRLIAHDLRDILVEGENVFVSRFKSAEVMVLDRASFAVLGTVAPVVPVDVDATANLAWRMIPSSGGGVLISHQFGANPTELISFSSGDVPNPWGAPTDGCNQQLSAHVSRITVSAEGTITVTTSDSLNNVVLPLDFLSEGSEMHFVSSGQAAGELDTLPLFTNLFVDHDDDCLDKSSTLIPIARPVALAKVEGATIVVYANPTVITIDSEEVLAWSDGTDPSIELFHASTDVGISCAACHPDGTEDGHVWFFSEAGNRRTQSLAGHLMSRTPFHWSGDLPTLGDLMQDVFVDRMTGLLPDDPSIDAFGLWMDGLPPVQVTPFSGDVLRGAGIFADSGCADCHNGELFTDNSIVDVGTGEPLKVPHLIGIGYRAPYMHDGCADTLVGRFMNPDCAVEVHSVVTDLDDVLDLVAYLETL